MNDPVYTVPPAPNEGPLHRRYAVVVAVAAVVVALDQAVKALVAGALGGGQHIDMVGGAIRLDYTRNSGAAFGFYQGGGAVLAVIALAVCIAIVVSYRRLGRSPIAVRVAVGLILGGAAGNLIDRIRLGYVVDFIDLRWWPVFNLADSAIVIGVALLLLRSFLGRDARA